jgi:hypothetical protein
MEENLVVTSYTGSIMSINNIGKERSPFLQFVIDTIKQICDIKLIFQNWTVLLIALSNFFMFSGYFIPYIYIPKVADKNSIENSSFIVVIIGKTKIKPKNQKKKLFLLNNYL